MKFQILIFLGLWVGAEAAWAKAKFFPIVASEWFRCEIDSTIKETNQKVVRVFAYSGSHVQPLDHFEAVGDTLVIRPELVKGLDIIVNGEKEIVPAVGNRPEMIRISIEGKKYFEVDLDAGKGEFSNPKMGKLIKCAEVY